MTNDLSGKTAVVTGASRGLGAEIAHTFAHAGSRVILLARSSDQLQSLAAELPNDPAMIVTDLSQPDSWQNAAEQVNNLGHDIDILVNNAGTGAHTTMADMQAADFDQVMMVNVRNLVLLTHALTPKLVATRGSVVNISSVASQSGLVGHVAYSTSKGAVEAFTRNAAIDLGRYGVRVNAVAPGLIDDGMWKHAFDTGTDREATMSRMGNLIPLEGRWGSAADIAEAVSWLASERAGYITGQVLRVDGGMK